MNFEAIIFDMDGLLVDSEVIWLEVETMMIKERGHEYTDEVRQNVIGLRLDEFMTYLRDHYQFPETVEALTAELIERFIALVPTKVVPQPGASEIIDYVIRNDIPRAIASSSPQVIIDAIVETMGWMDTFDVRCSADNEARGKPAPDVYLRAAEKLGVDPTKCLALEDSPNGSRAAVAAGMTCYAVPDTSHSKVEAFEGITPHVFESLHDVLEALKTHVH